MTAELSGPDRKVADKAMKEPKETCATVSPVRRKWGPGEMALRRNRKKGIEMPDKQTEIQALQAIVTGLSNQSFGHRIQGLVFGSKGLKALAGKYVAHADEEMA